MSPEEIRAAVRELFPRVNREEIQNAILEANADAFRIGERMPFTYDGAAEKSLRIEMLGALEKLVDRAVYAYAHSRNLEAVSIDVDDERRVDPFPGSWELRLRTTSGIVGSIVGPPRSDRPPLEIRLPVMHQMFPGIGYVRDPRIERDDHMTTTRFEINRVSLNGIAHYHEVFDRERYGWR